MPDARRQLHADLHAMARTGRNPRTGGPISAALARKLPKLIAAASDLVEAMRRAGGHAHG